ncbi:MAG: peptidase M14, partial [Bacteroidetes bacterium]|nr:peptidase M14 [Bacteroidota bacterium]
MLSKEDITMLFIHKLFIPESMRKSFLLAVLILSFSAYPLFSQNSVPRSALKALGAPNNPKVEVAWNRFYDTDSVYEILKRLNEAYPGLSSLQSIGKSYEGQDIWVLTITNEETGDHSIKPGMYIAASIHANEVQATEVSL